MNLFQNARADIHIGNFPGKFAYRKLGEAIINALKL